MMEHVGRAVATLLAVVWGCVLIPLIFAGLGVLLIFAVLGWIIEMAIGVDKW